MYGSICMIKCSLAPCHANSPFDVKCIHRSFVFLICTMFQNRNLRKYKLHHFFFWMLVFGLWYYLRYQDYSTTGMALQITLLKVTDLALLVYITNYLLIPKLIYKRRYLTFAGIFILLIVASAVLKVFMIGKILDQPQLFSLSGSLKTSLYENVISDFFLVMAGAAFRLIFDYTKMQQRLAEVAKEKAVTELNFLKSQINPHFLFNSLNSVYFLINKDNADARAALHKFSEMLRYQLYEINGDKIPIEKEISYLKDYVSLQQLRKDEKYSVEFNCPGEINGFSIEPLLLIPFVENAFKHISHYSDHSNFIKIYMSRQNGTFLFKVENSTEAGMQRSERKQTKHSGGDGIGLANVRRRLELLYPDKHELMIDESSDLFSVKLKLDLE
jgi:two-component system, LytTR family, sensor kinase